MIDCLLIVVSYRSASEVPLLMATVPDAVGDLSWHAVLVNNDPSEDLTYVVAGYPEAHVIEAGANLGYSGGINLGMSAAPPSRWTVFLNPDVRLEPGALERMAMHASDERAVVPAIVSCNGVLQRSLRREPTILASLGDALLGSQWDGRPQVLSETIRTSSTYLRRATIDWATGAALLVPTPLALAIGEWDADRFFLYSEETDYCRRLRASGIQIHFLPEAVVVHREGGSGGSPALHALLEVNRVRYFRKWHSRAATAVFTAVVVLNSLLRLHRHAHRAALGALLWPPARRALPGGPR